MRIDLYVRETSCMVICDGLLPEDYRRDTLEELIVFHVVETPRLHHRDPRLYENLLAGCPWIGSSRLHTSVYSAKLKVKSMFHLSSNGM